ncbi:MAG: hypothetical protein JXA52_06375 [Planctomycetes bacterium]|nr:hypothetical protein [Planctomycetota bacterium]
MSELANVDLALTNRIAEELKPGRKHDTAIALDFDGVCKLFTKHKHQIMFTLLFLHVREFQRVSYDIFREAYSYINFKSPEYAGKERFRCVNALAAHLVEKGYPCGIPGVAAAVQELEAAGRKLSAENLKDYADADDVARLLAWSEEVNQRLTELTEIGLVPGLQENIFTPFREKVDFYLVSTASEGSIRASMEKEGIDFIARYFGQESATKAESLVAFCKTGYKQVIMFGDHFVDTMAAQTAAETAPPEVAMLFAPVIPDEEEASFAEGKKIIDALFAGDRKTAEEISDRQTKAFAGREANAKA